MMYKYKIDLVTTADITEFVSIATAQKGEIRLVDGTGFCVSGKSLLGAMAAVEWKSLYCLSEDNIYALIKKFCTE